jgi:uncharacterized protein YdeI (YjbR/CyaY-like superfamily)
MTPDGGEAMVKATPDGALALIEGSLDVFFSYGTWTTRNGSLGVHLARAKAPMVNELVTMAWRSIAPKSATASAKMNPSGSVKTTAKRQLARAGEKPRETRGDPRVDAAIAAAPDFAKPILAHLRSTVHEAVPGVTEDIKWRRPFFVLDGELLANMVAFKQHCSFGFWSREMNAWLVSEGIDGADLSGSFGRLTKVADLPSRRAMVGYIRKAAELLRAASLAPATASRARARSRPAIPMPDDFAAALARSKAASRVFEGFAPSCKREYLEWITNAKRQETRERRIAAAVARIEEGMVRHEEYRR